MAERNKTNTKLQTRCTRAPLILRRPQGDGPFAFACSAASAGDMLQTSAFPGRARPFARFSLYLRGDAMLIISLCLAMMALGATAFLFERRGYQSAAAKMPPKTFMASSVAVALAFTALIGVMNLRKWAAVRREYPLEYLAERVTFANYRGDNGNLPVDAFHEHKQAAACQLDGIMARRSRKRGRNRPFLAARASLGIRPRQERSAIHRRPELWRWKNDGPLAGVFHALRFGPRPVRKPAPRHPDLNARRSNVADRRADAGAGVECLGVGLVASRFSRRLRQPAEP